MSCADDPRKRFWTNLGDANIEDGPGGFQYLTLEPGTYFLDPSRKISSILLRPCYKDLWNLVLESACISSLNPFGFLMLFSNDHATHVRHLQASIWMQAQAISSSPALLALGKPSGNTTQCTT